MAVRATVRQPDIIVRESIPLEATSDAPLGPLPEPPTDATNDPSELAAGGNREITGEELAVAERARRPREPAERAAAEDGGGEDKPVDGDQVAEEDNPNDPNLPGYAVYEIAKTRRSARQRVAAAEQASQAAQKAAEEAQAALEAMQARMAELEAARPPAEPAKPPQADPRPNRYDFDDPDAYDDAIAQWGIREGVRTAEAKAAEEAAAAKKKADDEAAEAMEKVRIERLQELDLSWREQLMAATEKYPDFEKVAQSQPDAGGPTVTDLMAATIVQMESGAEVLYYLGQNAEESVRIARMSPVMQSMALGRIAERLDTIARPAPRRRAAENPIEPIESNNERVEDLDREESVEEVAERHAKRRLATYRPFFPPSEMH